MTTMTQSHINRQLRRLGRVRYHVSSELKGVLYELETTIEELGADGIAQAGSREVQGPCGQWEIAWLVSGGQPWVTLKWPRDANSRMIDFFCRQALRFELAIHRRDICEHDRLWIPLCPQ